MRRFDAVIEPFLNQALAEDDRLERFVFGVSKRPRVYYAATP